MAEKRSILLSLVNTEEMNRFTTYLTSKGYFVLPATDGSAAMESALKNLPSAIIVDVEIPIIDGEKLFHILKNNPHTRNVPFIFVSSKLFYLTGFRVGMDSFLVEPIQLDELNTVIKKAISSAEEGKYLQSDRKEIEGRLSQMSLADILQFLQMNRKEGELKITYGEDVGRVHICSGQVFNATLHSTECEKAVYRLLSWGEGYFEFIPKTVDMGQKIMCSTDNLLMEGMRQFDELNKAKATGPAFNSTLTIVGSREDIKEGELPVIFDTFDLVDEHPLINDLIDNSTFTDFDVYTAIIRLIEVGVLKEVKGSEDIKPSAGMFIEEYDESIKLNLSLMSHFTDMVNAVTAKIYLIAANKDLLSRFMESSQSVPGFKAHKQPAGGSQEGEAISLRNIATLRLTGTLEAHIIVIPPESSMGPILSCLSPQLVGTILLWDGAKTEHLEGLATMQRGLNGEREIPTAYAMSGGDGDDKALEAGSRKALGIDESVTIHRFNESDKDVPVKLMRSLIDSYIKDTSLTS